MLVGSLFSLTQLQVLLTLTGRWPFNGRSLDGPPLAAFQEETDTPALHYWMKSQTLQS